MTVLLTGFYVLTFVVAFVLFPGGGVTLAYGVASWLGGVTFGFLLMRSKYAPGWLLR